ncbi:hypothetical protein BC835DRAFT_1416527 [Cytidiella melzeri]|nr:hypothetical protein BC835DRAFT_1416527 [Cytidiella melzeri]
MRGTWTWLGPRKVYGSPYLLNVVLALGQGAKQTKAASSPEDFLDEEDVVEKPKRRCYDDEEKEEMLKTSAYISMANALAASFSPSTQGLFGARRRAGGSVEGSVRARAQEGGVNGEYIVVGCTAESQLARAVSLAEDGAERVSERPGLVLDPSATEAKRALMRLTVSIKTQGAMVALDDDAEDDHIAMGSSPSGLQKYHYSSGKKSCDTASAQHFSHRSSSFFA